MKRFLAAIMCLALMVLLCACGNSDKVEVEATAAPAEDSIDNTTTVEIPVISAESTAIPDVAISAYTYTKFTLDTGFSMDVPTHWVRQPASSSVCFMEPVADGVAPGRVVVSSKKLEAVGSETREKQLRSYFANILSDFDTYEWSDIYTDQPFLGDDQAHSVTYGGTRKGLAYKGYVILAAVDKTIYVYHFRCADTAYADMENIMIRMRDSISLGEK